MRESKTSRTRSLGAISAIPCLLLAIGISASVQAQTKPVQQLPGTSLGVAAAKPCADLAATPLTDIGGAGSKIVSATEVDRAGHQFCEVEGILAPSIGFKVLLPVSNWTQRYLQVGCGGLCGQINLEIGAADGCVPVSAGNFVVAATDMGHQGMAPDFGRDPQKRVDFAYRGVHLTALAAKKLIKTYYGQAQAYSYFTGCSDGGREALMEAQRYPNDFNGIVAGAPAMLFQFQNSLHHGWLAASNTGLDGKAILTAARLPLLHKAVMDACDGLDGQTDGLLSDPRLCHFDPKTLQCPPGSSNASACLTPEEVDVVTKFYAGPRDPATGEHLTVGDVQFGSELAWAGVFVPESTDRPIFSTMIAMGALQNLLFEQDPPKGYTLADLKFEKSSVALLKARHALFDATNPDLSKFQAAGGKLILWHGWADQHISPLTTVAYHEAILKQMGKDEAAKFQRLYLLPGVYHCGKGEGPSAVDFLTPMMDWVERAIPPEAVITQTPSGNGNNFGQPPSEARGPKPAEPNMPKVKQSRPVYPYPAVAKYQGAGDPNSAASYVKAEPLHVKPTPAWAGEDFLKPYAPSEK
ncbi:MAG: tannase [Rhodoferax ferrireducens]|uniref:Tannase n=1 Tax=Rhodoferax ferrireducens TaxID=192843 RepID=A0A1W9KVA6_9BURK|nr:MAG: tannase [Rhodoferax ferrireducens]